MAGGTSGFNMIQSGKDNRSIKPGRTGMADNPYATKGISLDSRNPKNYKTLIQHRFGRKSFLEKITVRYYLVLGITVLVLLVYFGFFS